MTIDPAVRGGFPDPRCDRAAHVIISPWFTGDEQTQRATAETVTATWDALPAWPGGLISLNCFASLDGEALLVYSQWTHAAWWEQFVCDTGPFDDDAVAAFGPAETFGYRLDRSLVSRTTAPTSLVTATFDVDGRRRQRYLVDALCAAAEHLPVHPAGIGSHFHLSLDGTRVVNYSEWDDEAAHSAMMDSGAFDEIYRISTETPGVRATRGRRYRLHSARTAP